MGIRNQKTNNIAISILPYWECQTLQEKEDNLTVTFHNNHNHRAAAFSEKKELAKRESKDISTPQFMAQYMLKTFN